MAEDLLDGEFWLPSQILTDDDILIDFDFSTTTTTHHGSSSSISDIEFSSFAETESDEDDIQLAGLTRSSFRQDSSNRSLLSKGCGVLSSSPQSTLYGFICHQSSSRESVSPPPQKPPPQTEDNNNKSTTAVATAAVDTATLDLLNKAAGEVARLKISTERKAGTGFFDCSKNGVVAYPPPLKNLENFQPKFHHFPSMVLTPSNVVLHQAKQKQQQTTQKKSNTKNNSSKDNHNNNSNNNRPLGLPPSAWPPLQAQSSAQRKARPQVQPQPQPQPLSGALPKGTGFFMPRLVASPVDQPSNKADGITTKSKSGKGSNKRRNSSKTTTTTTTDDNDVQLPQEWIY